MLFPGKHTLPETLAACWVGVGVEVVVGVGVAETSGTGVLLAEGALGVDAWIVACSELT